MTFSKEALEQLIDYDPSTGAMLWKKRGVGFFKDGKRSAEVACRIWNSKFSGKPALNYLDNHGYLKGCVLGKNVKAHQVALCISTGEWPKNQVDHINGRRDDNRACNLRSVTHKQNGRNQSLRSSNKSGVMGVHWFKTRKCWRAEIWTGKRSKHLGYFSELSEASEARKAAEAELSYHPNHGRSAG